MCHNSEGKNSGLRVKFDLSNGFVLTFQGLKNYELFVNIKNTCFEKAEGQHLHMRAQS